MKKTSIQHISNEHNDWLRSLDFYKQELGILKSRLTEIGGKNTGKDMAVAMEQFENRFIVQQDNIDRLRHDIQSNVKSIGMQAQANSAMYVDADLNEQHSRLGDAFAAEEQAVNDLRSSFNRFSAEWM